MNKINFKVHYKLAGKNQSVIVLAGSTAEAGSIVRQGIAKNSGKYPNITKIKVFKG